MRGRMATITDGQSPTPQLQFGTGVPGEAAGGNRQGRGTWEWTNSQCLNAAIDHAVKAR